MNFLRLSAFFVLLSALILQSSCTPPGQKDFSVDYEKFVLDNGLEVIFHKDDSDPVTAVALTFHVGSARELPGRTGFAHLFEHLLFLESENLGRGGLDQMSSRIGGSGANGSTSRDRTNYFQTVPNDALEKMIWAEADKLGFFINTVNEMVLEKEKQVVKNEKRQGVDNAPYGHTGYVIGKNLYPEDHPYSWQVIGSLDDLQAATLDDVINFYNTWYVPNNATLVIAGDFDSDQAREWVHKYFDEIPAGEEIEPLATRGSDLSEIKKLYHEDNYARLPELRLTWPGVELYHDDAYALDILAQLLSDGKTAPLYEVIVEEEELSSGVSMFSGNSELAGEITLRVRAFAETDLNDVYAAIEKGFARYEENGFTENDLVRVKAGIETGFYNGLQSVLGKAFQLAQYNIFAGDPGYINEDIRKTLDVTLADVRRVYETYVKDQPFVATSFVPLGETELVLAGSSEAEVAIEEIVAQGEGEAFELPEDTPYERTPSSFDRSVEPPYGASPEIRVPEVWTAESTNGMKIYGIENDELPLVRFNLRIESGMIAEDPEKIGVSNLLAEMLTRGTANRTPAELEQAIDLLGASINVSSGRQDITLSANTLTKNYEETLKLAQEILLEPRWDEREFELARQSVISRIAQQQSSPNSIATNEFNKVIYGEDHIFSRNPIGTVESVEAITMDDLKAYYEAYVSPTITSMHVAGSAGRDEVVSSLDELNELWQPKEIPNTSVIFPEGREEAAVFFYDVPNASQSVLRIGYLSMPETDEDYYPAVVMNYKLGGGGFASRLTQELREGKGFTYGIGSGFSGTNVPGPFIISSGVRSNVTLESLQSIKTILEDYPETFTQEDLENTKSFLLKSNARAFETLGAKLNILETMSMNGWEADYITQRQQIVRDMTLDEITRLARTYANPGKMVYVIVGDARTQLPRLRQLGYGEPILLN
ncbi:peptidase M16 [Rhodohalobacter mucosus]|uniref:Peptidase M16 n=2 Tax=Rhodohalobacter mucosus TaxID=2079485 RepID=A0A316TRW9_9BACT|nr:peptidase M16 [Rhodohalobacter mucosus]